MIKIHSLTLLLVLLVLLVLLLVLLVLLIDACVTRTEIFSTTPVR